MKTNLCPVVNCTPAPRGLVRKLLAGIIATASVCAMPGTVQATQITLDNSSPQFFALDAARHFLITGESNGPGGTKHLDVINTLTNTVVGNYSFSGNGYSSQLGASGTNAFWADQGDSLVRVIAVSAAGVPTLTRSDNMTLATGVAALSTTYGAALQGTGDVMKIVNTADGSVSRIVNLGGVASSVTSDSFSNLYYAKRSDPTVQVIDTSGNIIRTLIGNVAAVDAASTHHFVYFESGSGTQVLQQLNGSDDSSTGKSHDFGAGASITNVAVDGATGNLWVSLQSRNSVVELDSNLNTLQQFSVSGPEAIAFDNGAAYVHAAGTSSVLVLVPEPSTGMLLAMAAGSLVLRRRRA